MKNGKHNSKANPKESKRIQELKINNPLHRVNNNLLHLVCVKPNNKTKLENNAIAMATLVQLYDTNVSKYVTISNNINENIVYLNLNKYVNA